MLRIPHCPCSWPVKCASRLLSGHLQHSWCCLLEPPRTVAFCDPFYNSYIAYSQAPSSHGFCGSLPELFKLRQAAGLVRYLRYATTIQRHYANRLLPLSCISSNAKLFLARSKFSYTCRERCQIGLQTHVRTSWRTVAKAYVPCLEAKSGCMIYISET